MVVHLDFVRVGVVVIATPEIVFMSAGFQRGFIKVAVVPCHKPQPPSVIRCHLVRVGNVAIFTQGY